MHFWLNFWNLLFWFSLLGFLINASNFLNLFLYSEVTWLILYNFSTFSGILLDDLNLLSTTFFILALAGLEFAIGFLLIILFKNFNTSNVFETTYQSQLFNFNKSKINTNKSIFYF